MEISLFQADEPLRFERIIIYPYPDLKRIWVRAWMTAVQDQQPNIEIIILNPDGSENNSVYLMNHAEQRLETTMHMRKGVPGTTYHVVAVLSLGVNDQPEVIDHQEFDLILEFRDPEARQPGFGMGVDWSELQQAEQQEE